MWLAKNISDPAYVFKHIAAKNNCLMFNPRFVKLPSSATTSHLSLANLSIKRDYFEYERFMKSGALQRGFVSSDP